MVQFLKTRLGMFTVFAVILAGALILTLFIRHPVRPAPVQVAQDTEKAQPPVKTDTTASVTEHPIQSFQNNVPVDAMRAPRPDQPQQEEQVPPSAVQIYERQSSHTDNSIPQSSDSRGQQGSQKQQQAAPPTMATFSKRRIETDASSQPAAKPARPVAVPAIESSPITAGKSVVSQRFLPYGRFIKAELVNAIVSSTRYDSPIVGLVTEDVKDWSDNEVIIPAGSEIHGTGKPDKQLQRMFSSDQWIVILPKSYARMPGGELRIRAMALDRDEKLLSNGASTMSIDDGAPGIVADVVKTDDEIKLFLGEALKGFALTSQSKDTQSTITGTTETVQATTSNALMGAGAAVADRYAQIALDEFKNNGWFLRVKPAKQFYLYIEQTLDMNKAEIGYTLSSPAPSSQSHMADSQSPSASESP